jgi:hypothetical protein
MMKVPEHQPTHACSGPRIFCRSSLSLSPFHRTLSSCLLSVNEHASPSGVAQKTQILAVGWLAATVGVMLLRFCPWLIARWTWTRGLLAWGKLATKDPTTAHRAHIPKRSVLCCVYAFEGRARSHDGRWFWHFYLIGSLVCAAQTASLFTSSKNMLQVLFERLEEWLPAVFRAPKACTPSSSSVHLLALALLHCQLARRLAECLLVLRPSPATMHVGHYAVGVGFYLAFTASLFADCDVGECASTLSRAHFLEPPASLTTEPDVKAASLGDLVSLRVVFAVLLFACASYNQFLCHRILANLRRGTKNASQYSVPRYSTICMRNRLPLCAIYSSQVSEATGLHTCAAHTTLPKSSSTQRSPWYGESSHTYSRTHNLSISYMHFVLTRPLPVLMQLLPENAAVLSAVVFVAANLTHTALLVGGIHSFFQYSPFPHDMSPIFSLYFSLCICRLAIGTPSPAGRLCSPVFSEFHPKCLFSRPGPKGEK